MKFSRSLFAGLLAIPLSFFATSAQATPVNGIANIAGNVTVSATSINFAPTFVTTAGAMETGDFMNLTGGSIQSLTGGPATGATNMMKFVTFDQGVATPVYFDLTYIAPGVGNQADCTTYHLGGACTLAGSPFTLFQLSSNTVIASLQLNGVSYMGSADSGSSPTVSIFSTQTALNGTIPQITAALAAGQTLTGITYSASFNATAPPSVPEPASMMLMGLGLVGAGLVARRKMVKN